MSVIINCIIIYCYKLLCIINVRLSLSLPICLHSILDDRTSRVLACEVQIPTPQPRSLYSLLFPPILLSSWGWLWAGWWLSPSWASCVTLVRCFLSLRLSFPTYEMGRLDCNKLPADAFYPQGSSYLAPIQLFLENHPISHFFWELRSLGQTGVA